MRRWVVCLLFVPLLSGCKTGFVRRGVERRLERKLASFIGPADRYRVRIHDTRDSELVLGRARRVEITGEGIRAKGQFDVDALRLAFIDLRYEGGDPELISVRRSDLEVEFTDRALNDYLRAYHARYNPEVRFEPDSVHVTMTYPFLGVPTVINARGRFVIQEGRKLLFDAETADVSFLNTPGFAERFVEDRVNPLLDISRFDFPARLESVQVLQGRIRAQGSAALRKEL
jgi:hypothetical protein